MRDVEQHRNGNDDDAIAGRGSKMSRPGPPPLGPLGSAPRRSPPLTAIVVGGLVAFVFLAALASVVFLGIHGFHSSPAHTDSAASSSSDTTTAAGAAKPARGGNLLSDPAVWELSQEPAKPLTGDATSDIGWWTRMFYLPRQSVVLGYLKNQGLNVTKIVPARYEDTKDATTITYDVYAEVPAQLLKVDKMAWKPADPDMQRFTKVLVLNKGLPAGNEWDTQNAKVTAETGTKLSFAWQLRYEKNYNSVETDRLPFTDEVFTQPQLNGFQTEAANTLEQLQSQMDQISAGVQGDVQSKLASVPADPPKPELMSTHWNHGDGSGEPTRSAERIGGGTVAGAAGGAAIGAAAGDAGMGAGIGAGVGLLGGFIYDTVSKNNDRHRYEDHARAVNAERMGEWRTQVKALDKQRNQIKQDGVAEKEKAFDELATRIAANNGQLDGVTLPISAEPIGAADGPSASPAAEPTTDQPSGPIAAPVADGAIKPDGSVDAALKKKLIGFWKSPRHAYHYTDDGTVQMINGETKDKWNIVNGVYHEYESDGHDYTYDIVTLTDNKFVYRSHDADPMTFTITRISRHEAEEY